jgi:hypothetical protein
MINFKLKIFNLLFILCLNLNDLNVATYELKESNKTILIQNYYDLLLNNSENKTNSQNIIKSNDRTTEAAEVDELKKQISKHEELNLIQINNFDQFFPNNEFNLLPYCTFNNYYLNKLKILNLSGNNLKNITISRNNFCKFESLRYVDLSNNKLTSLDQNQMNIFKMNRNEDDIRVNVEVLKLDHNELSYIKFSAFKNFKNLKYLDLSYNKLKYLHPVTINLNPNVELLDLSHNYIQEIYQQNYQNLKYLYLNSENIMLKCDCFLMDLFSKYTSNQIFIDDFKCTNSTFKKTIEFKNLDYNDLSEDCNNYNISIQYRIEYSLRKSTNYSYLAKLANRWFSWHIFPDNTVYDVLPKIPMMIDNYNTNSTRNVIKLLANRLTTINITCDVAESNSFVIWKTPFGYFVRDENLNMFHKMSNLTKVFKLLELETGPGRYSGANTLNKIYVSANNELIVTNFRQIYTGDYTCIALNSLNYDSITFNINGRVGVSDHFLYCIAVSIISSLIPAIFGIIFCIVCEKQAIDSFPMTPPVFPTPLDTLPTTPPNFDFNQWMSNTASNIQGTLDQASKKLRKGIEKATVTVKSIGVTSTAYFYSVYEQSTQRLHTIKSYKLPTLPTVSLPAMKYSNQIATRMGRLRTGVADVFLQFREFCGSSDLTHTASIATIESDTNASATVGYIVGKISHMESGMNFIAEEGNMNQEDSSNIDAISVYREKITRNKD